MLHHVCRFEVIGVVFMQDDEAFALLARIMKSPMYHMRGCFLNNLPDVAVNSYVIKRLMWEYLPVLAEHLERVGVEPIFWFEWYAANTPSHMFHAVYTS
jgi:hypothetical protein